MKNSRTFLKSICLPGLALFWLLMMVHPAATYASGSTKAAIPDPALEQVLRVSIAQPTGDLTTEDLQKATSLYAYQGENIRSLEGLEHAVNISKLVLDGNPIEDFTPLASLTNVEMLGLTRTGIQDLSPLNGMVKLQQLLASNNGISDLTPLKDLNELTDLLLENNQIANVESLAGMSIRWLNLSGNRISDISVLLELKNLKHVDLSGNPLNEQAPAVIVELRQKGVEVSGAPGELSSDAIEVLVDGEGVSFEQAPLLEDGTTLVPFRAIFETLGLIVGWDADTQTVTGTKDRFSISMQIGSNNALLNGKAAELSLAPRIINGSTFVPLRFIGEATGRNVEWLAHIRTIHIDTTFRSIVYETLYSNQLKYEGESKEGLPHGRGKYMIDGGVWYEGTFVEGRMEGHGKMTDPYDAHSYYDGAFADNVPEGQGKMVYNDGTYYSGSYTGGKRQGAGKIYFADGSLNFDGYFEDDALSGPGTLWTEEGDKYVGSFQYGMMFGPFKQYHDGKLVYDGEFQGSYKEGTGKEYVDSSLVYDGEFMYGLRNGTGKLYKAGKLQYDGEFDNGRPSGRGTFYSADGAKEYTGDVVNTERTGNGTLYYKDGTYYEGEVFRGKANGEGKLYNKDGTLKNGGLFYQDVYQPDPEKIKQTAEYRLLELKKSVRYDYIDGLDSEEDDLTPQQAAMFLYLTGPEHVKTYKGLSEKERIAFLNEWGQDHWGDVPGVSECFVMIAYDGEVIEGIVTSRQADTEKLKLVASPRTLDDFK
ncbi:stalk domain-containing protein [Paenibacillus mesotrionivorans]|uniref:Stalk domain-containing protein n=1 Tax=Paenibacillus mesotrionivorans TaxID=3160968 RepID=A0ACC7P2J3_9BACL